ncbi:hypothetical protein EJ07DRAFT_133366 [Lizonia empirigonia]|nr:hypothetical protein EJ07DRAFT_133366 [Lizonia empirigonia]
MQHNVNYTKGGMIGLSIAFMILPLAFMCLRAWAKLIAKRFALDDYLAFGALLVSITCCILQLADTYASTSLLCRYSHASRHQPLDVNGEPIMDDPGLFFFENTKFALNMISIVGLGLAKASILVMYKNIFDIRRFRIVVYIVLTYVVGWTIGFTLSHLFTCYPITVFIEPYYGNRCVETVPMFLSLLFTDVLADIIILILPIPIVLSIKLDIRKKLAVIGIFMLGAAICAVSITRVISTYSIAKDYLHHPPDVIYYTAPVFFWTNIELSLAIVCSCLPTLRPIWFHFHPRPLSPRTGSGCGSDQLTGDRCSGFAVSCAGFARKEQMHVDEVELARGEIAASTPSDVMFVVGEGGVLEAIAVRQVGNRGSGCVELGW